jgi:predicted N-acetyltransferase YhbS
VSRIGFVEAKEFSITTAGGDNYPAFMAMELKQDYLKRIF